MKIDSPNPNAGQLSGVPSPQDRVELSKSSQAQQAGAVAGVEAGAEKTKAAAAGAATDSAQLSGLSQLLRTQTEETPERAAFLARLERQVNAGEYNPKPADIARSIVDDLLKP